MTRINVGIEPWKLPDELLLADRYNLVVTYREIKRPIFQTYLKRSNLSSQFYTRERSYQVFHV